MPKSILSNDDFREEYQGLRSVNRSLGGPVCGAFGASYLDRPDEFIFNGTHGKLEAGGDRRKAKPSGFLIIHRLCKGKAGARISVSLDHQAQKERTDIVRILRCIVNGDSITMMRRILADPYTGRQIGVSRLYSRIFWLERTLLAFERAKLREWNQGVEASERFSHMRIAHDDVTVSVNCESRLDRRLTSLQFSVSADIRSGYVFRIPGTDETIEVPKLATTSPVMLTPAMRLGADPEKPNRRVRKHPDPRRVLYRPWLYHGTPLWRNFEDR